MIPKNAKIYIAGHRGMVGSACVRKFQSEGYGNLLLRTREELDLTEQQATLDFFKQERPEYVVLAAAKVGGIMANKTHMAEFLSVNLAIQNNVIWSAYHSGVRKLCFLGSNCMYPATAPQPLKEEYLLTGSLEPTNEGYALAKICGYKLCLYLSRQYQFPAISLIPCNLYGGNDNFHPEHSHVFAAFVRRFVEAADNRTPEITLWGSGLPRREFMHVGDAAAAIFHFLNCRDNPEVLNIGNGEDLTIRELAEKIAHAAGYTGKIIWDRSKPDGMFRKLIDSSQAHADGWKPGIHLDEGIAKTITEFRRQNSEIRR